MAHSIVRGLPLDLELHLSAKARTSSHRNTSTLRSAPPNGSAVSCRPPREPTAGIGRPPPTRSALTLPCRRRAGRYKAPHADGRRPVSSNALLDGTSPDLANKEEFRV